MIEQVVIACTELTAMWLLQTKNLSKRKYSSLFGLLGQPFWFYSSYISNQWGTFLLCFLFTSIWFKIFYDYWLTPQDKKRLEPEQYYSLLIEATQQFKNTKNSDNSTWTKLDRLIKEALGLKK